jgi:acyl dehydratase
MPLNQSLKGKEYPPVEFSIDRDKVIAFAQAIGEDDPIYLDAEAAKAAGYPEQVAPPTFAIVPQMGASGYAVTDPEMGIDFTRIVHGEQEFEYRRPLFVGDKLTAIPRVGDIYSRNENEFLVIEAECKDENGETVLISRSTLLSRGTAEGA